MAEMGEYKIKRPKFIVFTDKDGTLNLEDKQLNTILNLVTTMGGMVIPITGRTVGDIESDLKKRKIKVPEIIVGDNGSNIYHTKSGQFLVQRVLNHEKVLTIVKKFLEEGGNKDFIRFTNGRNIFASKRKEVKEYYKNSNMTILSDDIEKQLFQTQGITKITLAGNKKQIMQNAEFVESLGFWSDMNPTQFPKREYQNYILDIAQKNVNKGEAVKAIVSKLDPQYGYICIGNGYNDIHMFKTAIDDGMIASIMANSPFEIIEEMKQYAEERKKGKVMIIPLNKDLANQYILKMAKWFQSYTIVQERKMQRSQKLPNLPRAKVNCIQPQNISCHRGWRGNNRDR